MTIFLLVSAGCTCAWFFLDFNLKKRKIVVLEVIAERHAIAVLYIRDNGRREFSEIFCAFDFADAHHVTVELERNRIDKPLEQHSTS